MGALNRLIEAQEQGDKARVRLAEYQRTVGKPGAPPRFDDINELLVYIQRVTEYEQGLAKAEGEVKELETLYQQAADEVREFLPTGSQLLYEYQGQQPDFQNRRYVIHNRRGKVAIEGWMGSSRAP